MARRERPWYWRVRRAWYVNLNGKRHRLAADKAEAFAAWHRLAGESDGTESDTDPAIVAPESVTSPGAALTVDALVTRYLAAHAGWAGQHTRQGAVSHLGTLTAAFGKKSVAAVEANDFLTVAKRRRWAPASASAIKRRWAAMCNWAIEQRLIESNPLRGMRVAGGRRRTRRLILPTTEQVQQLLTVADSPLCDVLEALLDTGCRPSEVFRVTAADLEGDRWRFQAGKNGKPRTVYLTERVRSRCEQLAAIHPTGPLYRMADGSEWPRFTSIPQKEFTKLRQKCGLPVGITLYSFRHLFCTDALSRGVPDSVVAELAGNTPAVLQAHYAHLRDRGDGLRAALWRLRGEAHPS